MALTRRIMPTFLGAFALVISFVVTAVVPLDQAFAACVNARVKSWDVLWIRKGPGTKYAKRKGIPAGACGVTVTGTCEGVWCRVRYKGTSGWTNTGYLSVGSGSDGGGYGGENQCKSWERKCDNGADWACAKYDEQECGSDHIRDEYCISGPSSKLVKFRERPRSGSPEVGIGRGGDCGMTRIRCTGSWCKMGSHEFDGWLRKKDIRRKY